MKPERKSPGKTVLVTGGAGYIGSHTTRQLLDSGFKVVVLDNLYSGFEWAIPPAAAFHLGDAGDSDLLAGIFSQHDVCAVIHFAGHIVVPESVGDPLKYYHNNVAVSQRLASACLRAGVRQFIFSSSAAVYGIPAANPVAESMPTEPINPYGTTKLVTEWMLRDLAEAGRRSGADARERFRYVALRYFNVAGARADGSLGQATPQATHLIKVACEAACGTRKGITVFGTDYETPDGTCIRDYIHVDDLAAAHIRALQHLLDGGESEIFNCGYGHGFSVREVLETVKRVSGVDFAVTEGERRAGDPPALVADSRRIQRQLGWHPRRDDLELICRSAYDWECRLRSGRDSELP